MRAETDSGSTSSRFGASAQSVIGFIAGPFAAELVGRIIHGALSQPARAWVQFGTIAVASVVLIARRATRWFGIGAATGVIAIFGVGYLLAWWFADSLNNSFG